MNKTVLVTGGSKGIGYGIAEAIVKAGGNVTLTARNGDEVREAAERLSRLGSGSPHTSVTTYLLRKTPGRSSRKTSVNS